MPSRLAGLNGATSEPRTLSLFTGAGGLDVGLEAAGFGVAGCAEIDPDCRATLRLNRSWSLLEDGDITRQRPDDVLSELAIIERELALISAGPPCQPFSKAGQWRSGKAAGMAHRYASTLHALMDLIEVALPEVVLVENVTGFARSGSGEGLSGLDVLLTGLKRINVKRSVAYRAHVFTLDAADYGAPQHRQRVFVVAARDGGDFRVPAPTHGRGALGAAGHRFTTAWDAIGDLSAAGGPALTGKWADLVPSIPEGTNYQFHTARGDGEPLFGWRTRYWTFLLKLAKNRPSWTIQAHPGSATGPFHWHNRRLSLRELARLQTFPDDWKLAGGYTAGRRQIGNAVPVVVGELLGREIGQQLLRQPVESRRLSSVPAYRGACPSAEAAQAVPARFLGLRGKHPEHPGPGLGPGAVERERSPTAADA